MFLPKMTILYNKKKPKKPISFGLLGGGGVQESGNKVFFFFTFGEKKKDQEWLLNIKKQPKPVIKKSHTIQFFFNIQNPPPKPV